MSESDPIERLRALRPPPESPEEVHRSMDQILARLAAERLLSSDERFAAHRPKALVGFVRKPAFAAIVAALLLATAFLAMTPAGHAVANWLGEVFGVGEPGGRPSLNGPPEGRGAPWQEVAGDSRVLAVARLRDGTRVEVVGWRNRQGRPCFAADVSGVGRNVWDCAIDEERDQQPIRINAIRSGPLRGSGEEIFIVGRTRREVTSLRLIDLKENAVIGRAQPVSVPKRIRVLIGATKPFSVFILEVRPSEPGNGRYRRDFSLRAFGIDEKLVGVAKVRLDQVDGGGGVVPADSSEVETNKKQGGGE